MTIINVSWRRLKQAITNNGTNMQYVELPQRYHVAVETNGYRLECLVEKGTKDGDNFEATYKAQGNAGLDETLHFDGSVGTSVIKRPGTAGKELKHISLVNLPTNAVGDLVQFSLDKGTTYSDLKKGQPFADEVAGIKQVWLKSNLAGTAFSLIIKRKK